MANYLVELAVKVTDAVIIEVYEVVTRRRSTVVALK